jgi:PAS domain S-box-containing protein
VGLGPAPGPWALWPINGLLLGIFYRRPSREWLAIGVAATVAQTLTIYLVRGDVAAGATPFGAASDVVQAALAAWVLRRSGLKEGPWCGPREMALFVVVAVCAIPLLVTPVSGLALAAGLGLPMDVTWRPLFAGNSLSMLLFAPLLLPNPDRGPHPVQPGRRVETAVCQIAVLLVALATFHGAQHWLQYVAFPYAMFPLLAWSALRCGPRWTAAAIAVLSVVAAWCTARGLGPFATPTVPLDHQVLQLQAYLALVALTALLLSSATAQRQSAFAQLALQNAVQQAFFESSTALILLKDLDGRYVLVNRAAEAAHGVTRAEMIGRRAADVMDAADARLVALHDRKVLERGEPLAFEETLTLAGQRRQYMVTRFPVRDHGGAVRYLGMIGRDDTVERDLADRLQRAQRVEILGQLAAGLAHDLNNLLTVMVGNAGLVATGGGVGPDDLELLGEMRDAGDRATRLTGRLLSLGRATAAPRRPVDVDETMRGLEPLLQALTRGNVDLSLRLGAPGECVLTDPIEIEQVVLNLVSNARAAIEGEGAITVSTRVVGRGDVGAEAAAGSGAQRWLRLSVEDTGGGMDEATLSRLFQPFFTTRAGQKGTGLGLYTTSLLVRQMGGAIAVASRQGEGATFTIDLPCTDAMVPPATEA